MVPHTQRAVRTATRRGPGARTGSLGLKATTAEGLIRQVEAGFSFSSLRNFAERSGIPLADIASVAGIAPRTLARRRNSGRFTWDESERLLRISAVFDQAVELFEGDVAAAANWLTTPQPALARRTPLAYSRTEVGAGEVESLIGRLEHGVFV